MNVCERIFRMAASVSSVFISFLNYQVLSVYWCSIVRIHFARREMTDRLIGSKVYIEYDWTVELFVDFKLWCVKEKCVKKDDYCKSSSFFQHARNDLKGYFISQVILYLKIENIYNVSRLLSVSIAEVAHSLKSCAHMNDFSVARLSRYREKTVILTQVKSYSTMFLASYKREKDCRCCMTVKLSFTRECR